jgi:hypothetical protein
MLRVLTSAAAVLAGFAILSCSPAEAAPALNQKVLQYARSQMGRQVGNGECWTLADQALRAAGAHRPGTAGYATYVFGKRISRRSLQPGDVIQFEGVTFKHTDPNGSWSTNSFPHHTAIVVSVRGNRITLLNQNVNGNRTVQTTTISMADFQGGTMTYFRPQPR